MSMLWTKMSLNHIWVFFTATWTRLFASVNEKEIDICGLSGAGIKEGESNRYSVSQQNMINAESRERTPLRLRNEHACEENCGYVPFLLWSHLCPLQGKTNCCSLRLAAPANKYLECAYAECCDSKIGYLQKHYIIKASSAARCISAMLLDWTTGMVRNGSGSMKYQFALYKDIPWRHLSTNACSAQRQHYSAVMEQLFFPSMLCMWPIESPTAIVQTHVATLAQDTYFYT